jgi:hypothetical protein
MNNNLLPRDWTWYETYKSVMGVEALLRYINRVHALLDNMQPDSFLHLENNVLPENTDLFIKACCLFISEHYHTPDQTSYYEFNADCTLIRRVRRFPIKKIK